jgi:hypothetical protein
MKSFRCHLSYDGDDKDSKENGGADCVAQVHRHGEGIPTRFSERRREDFDDPEDQSDLGHFAQSNRRNSIHATGSSFCYIAKKTYEQTPSLSQFMRQIIMYLQQAKSPNLRTTYTNQ